MNVGRGEVIDEEAGPPRILTHVNEHAQLWTLPVLVRVDGGRKLV
jgi:hypothetical protein